MNKYKPIVFVDAATKVPIDTLTITDSDAHTSEAIGLGIKGFASAFFAISNAADQSVAITVYGKNDPDDAWRIVLAATTVAATNLGTIHITKPWAEIRLSIVYSVAPASGALRVDCILSTVVGSEESAAGGSVVVTDIQDTIALEAGETFVGVVGSSDIDITVTPTLETSSIDDGDVLFQPTEVALAARVAAGQMTLVGIKAVGIDDNADEITLHFFSSAVSFGSLDAAPSINDTDVLAYLGHVVIPDFKWVDLGGCQVATLDQGDVSLPMKAAAAATSIWVAGTVDTSGGTPTYTASGLQLTVSLTRA